MNSFIKKAEEKLIYVYNTEMRKSLQVIFICYKFFKNVFNKAAEITLLLHRDELNHSIELLSDTSSSFSLLYNLSEHKLEVLKAYINKNLQSEFITHFKSSAKALILFVKKKNESLRLCVNY